MELTRIEDAAPGPVLRAAWWAWWACAASWLIALIRLGAMFVSNLKSGDGNDDPIGALGNVYNAGYIAVSASTAVALLFVVILAVRTRRGGRLAIAVILLIVGGVVFVYFREFAAWMVAAKGLFVMDGSRRSAHSNAFFTGFGTSKRVVFFDTDLLTCTLWNDWLFPGACPAWERGEVERSGDPVDVVASEFELPAEDLEDLGADGVVDLEADGGAELGALAENQLHGGEEVLGLVGQFDVGVAGDAERVVGHDLHAREQHVQVAGDDVLERTNTAAASWSASAMTSSVVARPPARVPRTGPVPP